MSYNKVRLCLSSTFKLNNEKHGVFLQAVLWDDARL